MKVTMHEDEFSGSMFNLWIYILSSWTGFTFGWGAPWSHNFLRGLFGGVDLSRDGVLGLYYSPTSSTRYMLCALFSQYPWSHHNQLNPTNTNYLQRIMHHINWHEIRVNQQTYYSGHIVKPPCNSRVQRCRTWRSRVLTLDCKEV